jgi:hypothetical protein
VSEKVYVYEDSLGRIAEALEGINESLKSIAKNRVERHWLDKNKVMLFPMEEEEDYWD